MSPDELLEAAKQAVILEAGGKLCLWQNRGALRICRAEGGRRTCLCEEVAKAVLKTIPKNIRAMIEAPPASTAGEGK